MKRVVLPFAFALTLPALGSLSARPGKDDAAKIQGVWLITHLETNGNKIAVPGELKWKVGPDKFETIGKDDAAAYKLGADKNLGTFDITNLKGPAQGKTMKGVYELKGDELKVCMPRTPESERPREFTSKDGCVILYLKRDKP